MMHSLPPRSLAPNWNPKTMWTGDNLYIMRGMNSATVDLIYLDPPFNSKANYAAPIGSRAAGAAFKDTWTLDDLDNEWLDLIESKHPALHRVVMAAMTDSDKAYLVYMAARILEMKRLLKPIGSIYLHCDPTMSHYLKLVMDTIFGQRQFRTHIAWKRSAAHSDARQGRKQYGRVQDNILFYSNGPDWKWHTVYTDYDEWYVKRNYRHVEANTGRRYQLDNITGPGGASKGNPSYELMGITRFWRYSKERMRELVESGRIVQTAPGRVPRYKRYLDEMPGVPLQDIWTDISPIQGSSKERTGYPTQKPLALLERIIRTSSNVGDTVLDPFCGCATTCVAADDLGRYWVGIDISAKASDLVVERIERRQGLFRDIVHRTDIPQRTDLGILARYNCAANKQHLYGIQGGHCTACREHFQARHLEVDHIVAKSKGGTDHIDNLQLLCGHCNKVKGHRGMVYLRERLRMAA